MTISGKAGQISQLKSGFEHRQSLDYDLELKVSMFLSQLVQLKTGVKKNNNFLFKSDLRAISLTHKIT